MSTTIRIDDDMELVINANGRFGDTHQDVIKRLIPNFDAIVESLRNGTAVRGKKSNRSRVRKAAKHRQVTTQKMMVDPLGVVLEANPGCESRSNKAVPLVGKLVDLKSPLDFEEHKHGEKRWENNVHWARNEMVRMGFIAPTEESGVGIWRLTPKGIEYVRKLKLTKKGAEYVRRLKDATGE